MKFLMLAPLFMPFVFAEAKTNKSITSNVILASKTPAGVLGNAHARNISFSSNGEIFVFESDANNLIPGDTNNMTDVFWYSTISNTIQRVSVSSAGGEANAPSTHPMISGDGAHVVFMSAATNLVAGDTNNCSDIYVRDILTNTTTRISVGGGGVQANGGSDDPTISAGGDYIGFRSVASNLIGTGDTNGKADYFVYNRNNSTMTRASVGTAGLQGDGEVLDGRISETGNYVVFSSKASNMVTGDTNGCADVFVRNMIAGTTELISQSPSNNIGNRASYDAAISAFGEYVVFTSRASNLIGDDTNGYPDIFFKNRTTGLLERVNVKSNAGGQITGDSRSPRVTQDGRFVIFETLSRDLAANDTNNYSDIYLRDRENDWTELVSSNSEMSIANSLSREPAITSTGSLVGFSSLANNLASGDTNQKMDVFYRVNQLLPIHLPKILAYELPSGNRYSNSLTGRMFEASVTVDRPITSVTVNGIPLAVMGLGAFGYLSLNVGTYHLVMTVTDPNGYTVTRSSDLTIWFDPDPPVIAVGATPSLTNQLSYDIPVQVTDDAATTTEIYVNNTKVFTTNSKDFVFNASLPVEGNNEIRVASIDDAGNSATAVSRTIKRDTSIPTLTIISPHDGSSFGYYSIAVAGQVNEEILSATVNGSSMILSSDHKSFYGNVVLSSPGLNTLSFDVTDLAGNVRSQTIAVTVDLSLVPELWGYEECTISGAAL